MTGGRETLLALMRAVIADRADAAAVQERSRRVSYTEFGRMVGAYRVALQAADPNGQSPIGLLLDRSAEAYAAMWAAIAEGRPYVPLNPRYPALRLRTIIETAGVRHVFCETSLRDQAETLGFQQDSVLQPREAPGTAASEPQVWSPRRPSGNIAYILYTSGSTGQPKGVPISYDNLLAFVKNITAAIPFPPDSICSQVCELSFDFSVHEIFQTLMSGGTLCPARQIDLFNPGQFIADNSISVWISVPSLARVILANQTRQATTLDSIRLSIFNGEPLTAGLARDWQAAIPEAAVWNSYGPTECTVAVTTQFYDGCNDLTEMDVVSIGVPLPNCDIAVLKGEKVVPLQSPLPERTGELLLKTVQSFAGYTDTKLPRPFVSDVTGLEYYRTGDRVLWRDGRLFHLGRVDHQVKIGGHRIELTEVEWCLREALGTDALAIVAFPRQHPTELVLFVEEGPHAAPRLAAEEVGLPTYMLPKRTRVIERLPSTPHGKLDRVALQCLLEEK